MALLDMGEIASGEIAGANRRRPRRPQHRRRAGRRDDRPRHGVRVGAGVAVVGLAAQTVWLAWRVTHLPVNAVALVVLAVELAGVVGSLTITIGLARARDPRSVYVDDPRDSHRYAFAIADIVGRTRSTDVHSDVVRVVRAVPRRRPRRSAEAAMGAVYLEGPRRLALVVALSLGLLNGQAPMSVPPWWAVVAAVAGGGAVAVSQVALGDGRIRFGDRTRWSYSSIGETVGAVDLDGVAPRRWVGTMASIVVVNLAIALRGTSDRWTHGLHPMPDDQRVVTMALAIVVVVGALFTMSTTRAPELDDTGRSRRLDERSARQSVLGATMVIGLTGLLAGVLPGGVDAADDDPVRTEQLVDGDLEPSGG